MANIPGPQRRPTAGSGGKFPRVRRRAPASFPYRRPSPSPSPVQGSPRRTPGWVFSTARSIAAGAGKLLSIFRSDDSTASSTDGCTSSSSDEGVNDDESQDLDDAACLCSKETEDLNPSGPIKAMAPAKGPYVTAQGQKNGTKIAIEYLLLQETFTREECIKLTKIIQSRVVDSPSLREGEDASEKGHRSQDGGNITAPPETQVLHSQMKTPDISPYSTNRWSSFSPRTSALCAYDPGAYDAAITEAKKWLQEKKSEPGSQTNQDHGPCALNTDMMSYGHEAGESSPVDIAKSYMQKRPPWASPSLFSFGLTTPPSLRLEFPSDETLRRNSSHSFSSLQMPKRSSLSTDSRDFLEEIRRVRLKLAENTSEPSILIASSNRSLEKKISEPVIHADDKLGLAGVSHDSDPAQVEKADDGSGYFPRELGDVDACENGGQASHSNAVEGNISVPHVVDDPAANQSSVKNISEHIECAVAEKHNSVSLAKEVSASSAPNGMSSLPENNQDLVAARMSGEKLGGGSASHDSMTPIFMPTLQNGGILAENSSDQAASLSNKVRSSLPSATGHANSNTEAPVPQSSLEICSQAENVVENASKPQQLCFLGTSLPDVKPYQASDQAQRENGFSNRTETADSTSTRSSNGHHKSSTLELNAEPGGQAVARRRQLNGNSLSHGIVADSEEAPELLSEASMEAMLPGDEANRFQVGYQSKVRNSVKVEANVTTRKRGRTGRRGRGRGK